MKAPITQAQAWAVIAESAGWNAKELPVLPDPRIAEEEWFPRLRAGTDFYTADQIQAYGAACAAHARGMALEEVDDMLAKLQSAFFDTSLIRKAVKQMKAGK